MASNIEDKQKFSNCLAIVPYRPFVLFNIEPLSREINLDDSQISRKRKLRTTKVVNISHNHKFIRKVSQGDQIDYVWERDSNTIPMVENDEFKHELLEGWVVESRMRQDSHRKERYFYHPKVARQFRSVKDVQKFLASRIDVAKTIEEQKEANKKEVQTFLAECYENQFDVPKTIEEQEGPTKEEIESFLAECFANEKNLFGDQS